MITKHVARALNDAQRKRWIALLLDCADDAHGHRRFGGWGEVKGPYVP